MVLFSAQQHGLLCEVDSDEEGKELCDPFFAHCKAHADKDIAKRKVGRYECRCDITTTAMLLQRRDYLTVIKKHRTFKLDESDERVSDCGGTGTIW